MGAAGLTGSSFEMAGRSGSGMKMDLGLVPAREENMTPYEFMLSESQERMLICAKKGYEDKIILLDFFATWCPPCKAEIPHLTNIQKKYKDNFEIIGILLEQNKSNDELNNFIKQHSINYTVVNDVNGQKIANTIGNVRSIPTMFLINQKGNIIQHYLGIVPEEMLESDIKKALGK